MNQKAKAKQVEVVQSKITHNEHGISSDQVRNAGFIRAVFHIPGQEDELVWLRVRKVLDDKVEGNIYRKPERAKFEVAESMVIRTKDIVETRERLNGPLSIKNIKRYFP